MTMLLTQELEQIDNGKAIATEDTTRHWHVSLLCSNWTSFNLGKHFLVLPVS